MKPQFLFISSSLSVQQININNCSLPTANQSRQIKEASRQQQQIRSKSYTFSTTNSQIPFRKLKRAEILDGWELRTEDVHKVNPVHVRARTGLVHTSY